MFANTVICTCRDALRTPSILFMVLISSTPNYPARTAGWHKSSLPLCHRLSGRSQVRHRCRRSRLKAGGWIGRSHLFAHVMG